MKKRIFQINYLNPVFFQRRGRKENFFQENFCFKWETTVVANLWAQYPKSWFKTRTKWSRFQRRLEYRKFANQTDSNHSCKNPVYPGEIAQLVERLLFDQLTKGSWVQIPVPALFFWEKLQSQIDFSEKSQFWEKLQFRIDFSEFALPGCSVPQLIRYIQLLACWFPQINI